MNEEEKRGQIADALYPFFNDADYAADYYWDKFRLVVAALARDAIVAPVEITHHALTTRIWSGVGNRHFIVYRGHLGRPGEALAIILPLAEGRGMNTDMKNESYPCPSP